MLTLPLALLLNISTTFNRRAVVEMKPLHTIPSVRFSAPTTPALALLGLTSDGHVTSAAITARLAEMPSTAMMLPLDTDVNDNASFPNVQAPPATTRHCAFNVVPANASKKRME